MAAKNTQRQIHVYADWQGLEQSMKMGILSASLVRGSEIFSFQYDDQWIKSGFNHYLDPNLQLYAGLQYLPEDKDNFGIFLDSSPDRWGRLLMRRREAALARIEGRKSRDLFESDYLLGVYDGHRMGGIRFKQQSEGPYLNDNKKMASPPWTSLRELEFASLQLERDDIAEDPEYMTWLNMLVAPGSSLGGARPKASVVDNNDQLWIAKFPSSKDDKDIGAWEMVAHHLATSAGIKMAEAKTEVYSGKQHTFLTKRFDRTQAGERIHFASAMTLLGYNDGADHHDGVSYLDMASFIIQYGASVNEDLEELWRRIVFSICIKNTDDHLRNHGFLLTDTGWILSPAYDINPIETGTGLKLNITENENNLDLVLAKEVIGYFRLSDSKADEIIEKIIAAVGEWKRIATKYRIPNAEQEVMSSAFYQS